MIFLTQQVDPYLRKFLENNQEVNSVYRLDYYFQSFIGFVLCGAFTIICILLTALVVTRIIKYWQADPVRSFEIQRWLKVKEKLETRTIESKVNRIIKGSTVRFNNNKVVIKVPTKFWWETFDNISCRHEVKRRLGTLEFKEFLSTHYHGYRFGDVVAKRNCYILVGEVY